MFTFFHRTSKIYLDCFTHKNHVLEMTPIISASKAVPDWWKKLDKGKLTYNWEVAQSPRNTLTMKSCYGFLELYKRGVVIENWCDFRLRIMDHGFQYMYSDSPPPEEHSRHQIGEGFRNYHHLKLSSPWIFKEKTGVKFHFGPAQWSLEDYDFRVVPGVVDYRVNGYTNVNIMIPKVEKDQIVEYGIPVGQPLVHIIPLSDKKIVVKNHLISKTEYDNMFRHSASLFDGWKSVKRMLDRNDNRKGKCPFGFGDSNG